MKLLLDTHALLWALASPKKLPPKLVTQLENPGTSAFISAASTWEIAIKTGIGKLVADLEEIVAEARSLGFIEIGVSIAHTVRLGTLPLHHRDPFDRVLIAQAIEDGLTLVSRDPVFRSYGVATIWG